MKWLQLLICGCLFVAGCKSERPLTREGGGSTLAVKIGAASDLQYALEHIIKEFQEVHPELIVQPVYGSSGELSTQIIQGAPFDMFLSADRQYAIEIINRGFATPFSDFVYAHGHLVIWARKDAGLDVANRGIEVLRLPEVKKVAIANPDTAPYGRAAQAALQHFGLAEEIKDKLVLGENVAQTAHFVVSGGADVAVMAKSLALASELRDKGEYWEIPVEAHPTIEQVGVTMSATPTLGAVEELKVFLLGSRGREILAEYGFTAPPQ